jgi:hypothetical protein
VNVGPLIWTDAHRIVSRPTGPIAALTLLVNDARELDALVAIEGLTNPLARDAAGALAIIPPARRYVGPNATLVMTPFILPNASRFSDGSYGVLYAAGTVDTALRESGHHQMLRLTATSAPPGTTVPMFSFSLHIDTTIADVRRRAGGDVAVYDPASYAASQPFGKRVRADGHDGLHFDSVRHPGGECVGIFWPDGVKHARTGTEWRFYFDGVQISEYARVV